MTITLNQVLTIYIWFVLTILLVVLMLIARFYQRMAHEQTYFAAFVGPIVLFALASARNASINQFSGDPLADGLWFIGGIILIGLCIHLYHLMTTGR
jgi:hypothetical protein